VILAGVNSGLHTKGGEAAYSQYVRHLEKTSPAVVAQQTSGTVENFAQGYQDYLQAPLQVGPEHPRFDLVHSTSLSIAAHG
jgi:type II protein arginine methyltransferase